MMERDESFIRKEYRKALFPVMFSVLGGTINTLIDSAFVSQSDGERALAAVNMCLPIYLILCTIGVLFAGGAAAMSAWAVGEKKQDEAGRFFGAAIAWFLILGTLITAAGLVLARPLSELIAQGSGLSDDVFGYAFVSIIGTLPTIFLYLPIRYLQLEGRNKKITGMVLAMVISDVILDYLFLFVFHFGVRGAAAASVLSSLISCVYGFFSLRGGYSFTFRIKDIRPYQTLRIIKYGSPNALGNLVDALKMTILNAIVLSSLGEAGVAVWAVLNALAEFSITISSGVPQAAAMMIGVYYPPKENASIRSLVRIQLAWGLGLMGAFSVLLVAGENVVESIFNIQQSSLTIPLLCLAGFLITEVFTGIWMRYLAAIGRVTSSNAINISRKLVFPVAVAYILMAFHGYLWLFMPIGGVLTIVFGFLLLQEIVLYNKRHMNVQYSGLLLLNDDWEKKHRVLDFSIPPNVSDICDAAEKIQEFCNTNQMDTKMSMRLSLSIEELLDILIKRLPQTHSIDLRAFALEMMTGIQIRIVGERYNPFEEGEEELTEEEEMEMMGVKMLQKMAMETTHYYALGMNTIHIFFDREESKAINTN